MHELCKYVHNPKQIAAYKKKHPPPKGKKQRWRKAGGATEETQQDAEGSQAIGEDLPYIEFETEDIAPETEE